MDNQMILALDFITLVGGIVTIACSHTMRAQARTMIALRDDLEGGGEWQSIDDVDSAYFRTKQRFGTIGMILGSLLIVAVILKHFLLTG